ncbi:MAG TPA: Gfo/Idh/MocA family oxidoreductase [Phycisphaeraceae bacterium]
MSVSIGMIGLDTSHVKAFTSLLNDPSHEHHVPGGRVTVAYPGGSPDFKLSIDRVAGYTAELRDTYGVRIVDRIEEVAEAADVIFIESVDGRVHAQQFASVAPFGKPVFIDKPFTTSLADAKRIADLAQQHGVTLMSCSALRFCDELQAALAQGQDDIVGCDVYGPMAEEPTQPGLFWYGIHTVEMIVAAMGVGCTRVWAVRNDQHDLITMQWADGRVASLHGLRGGHSRFGMVLHRKAGPVHVNGSAGRPYYANLLRAAMESLPHGRSAVPLEQTLHIVQIIEAANAARQSGEPQSISEIGLKSAKAASSA